MSKKIYTIQSSDKKNFDKKVNELLEFGGELLENRYGVINTDDGIIYSQVIEFINNCELEFYDNGEIKSIKNEIKEFEQTGKKSKVFRNIMPLPKQIPIWLCGYTEHIDFKKTNSIPGQEFSGDRYVQSVSEMRNSDNDWKEFIEKL